MIDLIKHFPLCLLACVIVHVIECNVPQVRYLTHLEFLKGSTCDDHVE